VSKEFQFKLTSPAAAVIEKAKGAAAKNGVTFNGNAEKGSFSGMGIVGEYRIVETNLEVHIKQKPMIMTWGMIEKSLNQFFASA
jgi:hypothetical protein